MKTLHGERIKREREKERERNKKKQTETYFAAG